MAVDSGHKAPMRTFVIIQKWECLSVSFAWCQSGQRKLEPCKARLGYVCKQMSITFLRSLCGTYHKILYRVNRYLLNTLCFKSCVHFEMCPLF